MPVGQAASFWKRCYSRFSPEKSRIFGENFKTGFSSKLEGREKGIPVKTNPEFYVMKISGLKPRRLGFRGSDIAGFVLFPREVQPGIGAHAHDIGIDSRLARRFGIEGGVMGLRHELPRGAEGITGI